MKKLILTLAITGLYCSSYATKLNNNPYPINKQSLSQHFNLTEVKDLKIWKYFRELFPSTTITNIYTTPFEKTYAILAGKNIFYGKVGSPFIMVGQLFNPYTQQDLTSEIDQIRLKTQKIDLTKIDLKEALYTKAKYNPTGKKIIIFEDPDCPYCKVFEKQLETSNIEDKVDIYRILVPLPMHPNSKLHIQNIYCAKENNSLEILKKYMVEGIEKQDIEIKDGCNIDKMLERTGKTLRDVGVNGTPTIILGNGQLLQGVDINGINDYIAGEKALPKIVESSK